MTPFLIKMFYDLRIFCIGFGSQQNQNLKSVIEQNEGFFYSDEQYPNLSDSSFGELAISRIILNTSNPKFKNYNNSSY
jgi:hypothetical protein